MMNVGEAVKELRSAINYIDKEYSCDDRDLTCPNPDSISIALNTLVEKLTLDRTDSEDVKSCYDCNGTGVIEYCEECDGTGKLTTTNTEAE